MPKTGWLISTIVVLLAIYLRLPQPSMDWTSIETNARSFAGNDFHEGPYPLQGVTAVVTGATSGIGLALTNRLAGMGATVIALGRSQRKLDGVVKQYQQQQQQQEESASGGVTVLGSIEPVVVELSNLVSVRQAADTILTKYQSIDILVNNAGIHYANGFSLQKSPVSPDGAFDLSFAVNYLSHVLLTEKLLSALRNSHVKTPTVLQVSSSFHWAADGSELMPQKDGTAPLAAQPQGLQSVWRDQRAYTNSKLAQILHGRALAHRETGTVRFVSICPAWVATQIGGNKWSVPYWIMRFLAFPSTEFGLASSMAALFDGENRQNDFVANTPMSNASGKLPSFLFEAWAYRYGVRDLFAIGFAMSLIVFQKLFPAAQAMLSSPESYDDEIRDALFEWSLKAVEPFL